MYRFGTLPFCFVWTLFAQEYAGTKACVPCHAEQSRRHAASLHERALRPSAGSRVPALFDRPVRESNGLELTYDGNWTVTAKLHGKTESAPLTWIFGAGMLAFTPVGERDGVFLEHRASWYTNLHRPGMTMGHPASKPASAQAALGQPQTPGTIYRCFNCHATNVKPGPDLSAMTPGIQCERCHGPAVAHVKAPARNNIRRDASVEACAECHRMPERDQPTAPEKADPLSIRFAPVGLLASRCFQQSKTLTCVTCHDPHRGRAAAPYQAQCTSCHASTPRHETRTDCVRCHMPKSEPLPGLSFTDHRIR